MSRDTGRARLPALPPVSVADASLRRWIDAVNERLEVREGSRGNEWERSVTLRELQEATKGLTAITSTTTTPQPGSVLISMGPGLNASIPVAAFANAIRQTQLYRDLTKRLDDPTRFNDLALRIRQVLLRDLAAEAASRGADVRRLDTLIQDANQSLAMTITEITAALGTNAAGIREVQAAYVTSAHAQAAQITQLVSSLGNYYQDGSTGRVVLEEQLVTYASYTDGLRGQYTLKILAGGALAGFGLAASEVDGEPDSAFIIAADKFAIVSPTYSGGLDTSPDASTVPFGVDANGIYLNNSVYVNGTLRVGTEGKTLTDGLRGSLATKAYATAWSDTVARQAVWIALGYAGTAESATHLVIGDTVALASESLWRATSTYDVGATYTTGAVVTSGTTIYRAVAGSTGQSLSNEAYWTAIGTLVSRGEWATNTTYAVNDLVTNTASGGVVTYWLANAAHRSDPWIKTRGTWSSVTAYSVGDYVLQSSPLRIYKAKLASTNVSLSNTTYWELIGTYVNRGAWASGTSYAKYDVVTGTDASGTSRSWFANETTSSTVTPFKLNQTGGTYCETRYWSGAAWLAAGVVIDGNLLVNGTVSADVINGGTLSGASLQIASSAGDWLLDAGYNGTVVGYRRLAGYNIAAGNLADPTSSAVDGTTVATSPAAGVRGNGTAAGHGVVGYHSNGAQGLVGTSYGGSSWDFYAVGSGSNYGPFTGSHDCLLPLDSDAQVGDIVCDVEVVARKNLSNTICSVVRSTAPNQKGPAGVLTSIGGLLGSSSGPAVFSTVVPVATPNGGQASVLEHDYDGNEGQYYVGTMNAVGEGQLYVCGEGGDLQPGDLIVTSSTPGKGMKQSDDIVRSYTVAKVREAVTFSSPTEVKMVACIYLCG